MLFRSSGGAIHNLRLLEWGKHDSPPAWAVEFDSWMADAFGRGDEAALADYRERAPHARRAHARDEHLLPSFVAYGAGGVGAKGTRIHNSFTHGSLSMAAFTFE